jgi:translation initiation factor 4G
MKKITEDKKISYRVRSIMQDVLDLRMNGWKARREVAGPKTIHQIHADIEKEQLPGRRVRVAMFH